MSTLSIVVLIIVGLIFAVKEYVDHMYSPRKENFVVKNRLTRVPQMINSETHDVLAYSLGYS